MNEPTSEFLQNVAKESERRAEALTRLVSSADSSKVFGQPVTAGEFTVITASEVVSAGGFGSGMGLGPSPAHRREVSEKPDASAAGGTPETVGGGGGGGGGSTGRPVAAIIVTPNGVEVKPVLDVTKVALAALTAFGTIGVLTLKMLKKR